MVVLPPPHNRCHFSFHVQLLPIRIIQKIFFNIIYFYDYVYNHKYSLRFYMFVAIVFFQKVLHVCTHFLNKTNA